MERTMDNKVAITNREDVKRNPVTHDTAIKLKGGRISTVKSRYSATKGNETKSSLVVSRKHVNKQRNAMDDKAETRYQNEYCANEKQNKSKHDGKRKMANSRDKGNMRHFQSTRRDYKGNISIKKQACKNENFEVAKRNDKENTSQYLKPAVHVQPLQQLYEDSSLQSNEEHISHGLILNHIGASCTTSSVNLCTQDDDIADQRMSNDKTTYQELNFKNDEREDQKNDEIIPPRTDHEFISENPLNQMKSLFQNETRSLADLNTNGLGSYLSSNICTTPVTSHTHLLDPKQHQTLMQNNSHFLSTQISTARRNTQCMSQNFLPEQMRKNEQNEQTIAMKSTNLPQEEKDEAFQHITDEKYGFRISVDSLFSTSFFTEAHDKTSVLPDKITSKMNEKEAENHLKSSPIHYDTKQFHKKKCKSIVSSTDDMVDPYVIQHLNNDNKLRTSQDHPSINQEIILANQLSNNLTFPEPVHLEKSLTKEVLSQSIASRSILNNSYSNPSPVLRNIGPVQREHGMVANDKDLSPKYHKAQASGFDAPSENIKGNYQTGRVFQREGNFVEDHEKNKTPSTVTPEILGCERNSVNQNENTTNCSKSSTRSENLEFDERSRDELPVSQKTKPVNCLQKTKEVQAKNNSVEPEEYSVSKKHKKIPEHLSRLPVTQDVLSEENKSSMTPALVSTTSHNSSSSSKVEHTTSNDNDGHDKNDPPSNNGLHNPSFHHAPFVPNPFLRHSLLGHRHAIPSAFVFPSRVGIRHSNGHSSLANVISHTGNSDRPPVFPHHGTTVCINVGGRLFEILPSTFSPFPDSILWQIFTGTAPASVNQRGHLFFDRDGYLFEIVLSFARVGHFNIPSSVNLNNLISEAKFFGMYQYMFQKGQMYSGNIVNFQRTTRCTLNCDSSKQIQDKRVFVLEGNDKLKIESLIVNGGPCCLYVDLFTPSGVIETSNFIMYTPDKPEVWKAYQFCAERQLVFHLKPEDTLKHGLNKSSVDIAFVQTFTFSGDDFIS